LPLAPVIAIRMKCLPSVAVESLPWNVPGQVPRGRAMTVCFVRPYRPGTIV
jgi:hypothetical protein